MKITSNISARAVARIVAAKNGVARKKRHGISSSGEKRQQWQRQQYQALFCGIRQ